MAEAKSVSNSIAILDCKKIAIERVGRSYTNPHIILLF
jgi:hypothetical protein